MKCKEPVTLTPFTAVPRQRTKDAALAATQGVKDTIALHVLLAKIRGHVVDGPYSVEEIDEHINNIGKLRK